MRVEAAFGETAGVLFLRGLERRTKPDRAGQGDASAPRREDEGVRMHVESEQRRRATRIRRPATGGFVRRSQAVGRRSRDTVDPRGFATALTAWWTFEP